MTDCKRLKLFFPEKPEKYLQDFEHFSWKNSYKVEQAVILKPKIETFRV